jgi:hypothetical protein
MTDYELWLFGFVYPAAVVLSSLVSLAVGPLDAGLWAGLAGLFMLLGSAAVVAA